MKNSPSFKPVAIISLGCRLPQADSPEALWSLVRDGGRAWGKVPEQRFNRELYFHPKKGTIGKSYSDLGALVDYSSVDPAVTGFSAEQVRTCDLSHMAFCQTAVQTLQRAGLARGDLRGRNIGVYVGHAALSTLPGDFTFALHLPQMAGYLREAGVFSQLPAASQQATIARLVRDVYDQYPRRSEAYNPDFSVSGAAMWVARMLGLNGPAMVFNSACASSLQALAHAVKSIQLGKVEAALVGGVSYFSTDTMVLFSAAQSLTAAGSAPFTEGADGLVVGEGNVCVYLKPLEDAIRDRDPIAGVIRGVGISADGKGKSLWAPRMEGQVVAIRRAYELGGMDPGTLQYVEGHATSTNLGDKTELESLQAVFGEALAGRKIPIASLKWNIGHTLEVAGIAGLAKLLMCLQHGEIPRTVAHGAELNRSVDWQILPFYPPTENVAWAPQPGGPVRRGAVEAFGIGGLNVHVVVDGPEAKEEFSPAKSQFAVGAGGPMGKKTPAPLEIAVIGMGAVLPESLSVEAFRENRASGKRFVKRLTEKRWAPAVFENPVPGVPPIPMPACGVVDTFTYDWKKHKIPPKQMLAASPLQFMMLDAVDQAMQHSGYHVMDGSDGADKQLDQERTGCVVGTSFSGDFATQVVLGLRLPEVKERLRPQLLEAGLSAQQVEEVLAEYQEKTLKHLPALVDETGSFTSSALASRITKSFNFMGGAVAVDASMAGAAAGLSCCADMLRSGDCDAMIFVGGQQDLTPEYFQMMYYHGLPEMGPDGIHSPFDAKSAGSVPAEGCVALILKRLEDARRDGDRVYGILQGIGTAFQAEDKVKSVQTAVDRALENASVRAQDVRGVDAVSTGIARYDSRQWEGLESRYGCSPDGKPVPLASHLGQFGHFGAGSGAVCVLETLLALESQEMPRNGELTQPHTAFRGKTLQPQSQAVPLVTYQPEGRLLAAVDICSETEIISHIIMERGASVVPLQLKKSESLMAVQSQIIFFDATQRRIQRKRDEIQGRPGAAPVVAETPAAPVAVPEPVVETVPAASEEELKTFLVNFVVEQTGYPEEMVELDADLEADLGVDSIKKAQLFGELGEFFDIRPSEELSFDDFPTLRTILNFLVKNQAGVPAAAPVASAPVAAVAAPVAAPQPVVETAPAASEEELKTFLVNFVVEQTGYPEEMVELDADLEADLGVDSIKKAQLFGELGEFFDIRPSEELSFDDFPTLRTILNFLVKNQAGVPAAAPMASASVAAPVAPAAEPVSAPQAGASREELQTFLVNFVVEQTGYPEDMVELDADLEADLGVDSIKKAQLFGELGEFFDIRPSEDLSFDDFPTLRTILDFLVKNLQS